MARNIHEFTLNQYVNPIEEIKKAVALIPSWTIDKEYIIDRNLVFVSSTTTEYVGTHLTSGAVVTGDVIRTNDGSLLTTTNVVESGAGPYTYTCTFSAQSVAPTSAEVIDCIPGTSEIYLSNLSADGDIYVSFKYVFSGSFTSPVLTMYNNQGFNGSNTVDAQPGVFGEGKITEYMYLTMNLYGTHDTFIIISDDYLYFNIWHFEGAGTLGNRYLMVHRTQKYFNWAGGAFAMGTNARLYNKILMYEGTWHSYNGDPDYLGFTVNYVMPTAWGYGRNPRGSVLAVPYVLYVDTDTPNGLYVAVGELLDFMYVDATAYSDKEYLNYSGTKYKVFMTGDSYSSDAFLINID